MQTQLKAAQQEDYGTSCSFGEMGWSLLWGLFLLHEHTTLPTDCIRLERWEMHLFPFSNHLPFLLKSSVLSTFTNRTSVIHRAQLHIFNLLTQLSAVPLISSHPSFTFYSVFSHKQCENFPWKMILSVQVFAPPSWVFKRGADICLQKNSDLLGESSLSNLLGLFLPLNDIQ